MDKSKKIYIKIVFLKITFLFKKFTKNKFFDRTQKIPIITWIKIKAQSVLTWNLLIRSDYMFIIIESWKNKSLKKFSL